MLVGQHRSIGYKKLKKNWLNLAAIFCGCKVQYQGESSPLTSSLIISNHISWIDIMVLGGQFPVRFLAKSELSSWPVVGWLIRASGTLFIERGAGHESSSEEISQVLRQRDNVIIFPEATTTLGESVKPFHPRLLKSAQKADTVVIPVLIAYPKQGQANTDIAWADEHSLWHSVWHVLSAKKTEVIIHRFKALNANQESVSRNQLAKQAHRQIADKLEELWDKTR